MTRPVRWLVLVTMMTACGASATIVTDGNSPRGPIWLVGIARNAKLGAMIEVADRPVYCSGRSAWPAMQLGRPVVVAGTLETHEEPPLPIGPGGERSAGADGTRSVLAGCADPPVASGGDGDGDGVMKAEQALFAALAARDGAALDRMVDATFTLRVPGQPDVDRTAFLAAAVATPGVILGVSGEGLTSHRAGETGIVLGVQLARVRLDGQDLDDRTAFVDVFARRGDVWKLTFALVVPVARDSP